MYHTFLLNANQSEQKTISDSETLNWPEQKLWWIVPSFPRFPLELYLCTSVCGWLWHFVFQHFRIIYTYIYEHILYVKYTQCWIDSLAFRAAVSRMRIVDSLWYPQKPRKLQTHRPTRPTGPPDPRTNPTHSPPDQQGPQNIMLTKLRLMKTMKNLRKPWENFKNMKTMGKF